jgi:hypothetical protein
MSRTPVALAAGSGVGAILVSSVTVQTVFLTADFIVLAAAVLAAAAARFLTLARGMRRPGDGRR